MPEVTPEIMLATLSMNIMSAFLFDPQCILAGFLCQHICYLPNNHAGMKIMSVTT
jgi:hypothetical protein